MSRSVFTARRHSSPRLLVLLLGGALVLAAGLPLAAQTLTGEIDGNVRDATGAVVANAVVTITNADQNQVVRTTKTDHLGQFTAPLLTIGNYSVKITAAGFTPFEQDNITVHVGQPESLPINLAVGGASETVEVQTTTQTIQLDSAAAGTVIDNEQVTQLPLSNRNYLQLLSIQPGISGPVPGENPRGNIRSNGAVNTQTFSVNGNTTSTNGYYLDGADTIKRAGQQPVTFPGVDFTQEVNLLRGTYGADIGGPGAAVTTVNTKSGSTAFHGGAFGFFRSQIFNANTPTAKIAGLPRTAQRAADVGYFIGGPVWIPGVTKRETSKTFFFFGQEYLRELDGYTSSISNIPTLAQRAGAFTVPVCPTATACGTNGTRQIATINPVAAAYLKDIINFVPAPNNPADPQGLISNQQGTNNETQTIIRIDRQFTSKLSGFFRYLDDPFNLTVPFGFQQVSMIPGVATAAMTDGSTSWFGHLTYVLGANHVFEGGYSQRANWVTARDIGLIANQNATDVQINLPYANVLDHVPNIVVGGANYRGSGVYNERSPEQQVFLNNTNTLGRHTIKAGVNLELQVSFSNSAGANSGNFTFSNTPTPTVNTANPVAATQFAQAFADFLGGYYSGFNQANVDIDSALQSNLYEAYVEDDVHLTPRLTVLGGVRYTFFSPYSNAFYQGNIFHPTQNFYAPAFDPAQAPTLDGNGNLCVAGTTCPSTTRTPKQSYNPLNGIIVGASNSPFGNSAGQTPTNDFAPRFGFTYDVFGNGSTALRGGFGFYYDQIIGNTAKFPTNQDPPNVTTGTFAAGSNFANPGSGTTSTPTPQSLQAYQAISKSPYTEQYSLDLQQQIRRNISVDIGYYGNVGRHQQVSEDINQPAAGAYRTVTNAVVPPATITAANTPFLNLVRPYQNWSYISENVTISKSDYNGLQTSLRVQNSKGANFLINYTWARSLSNANSPQNNANLAAEYGPTAFDRNHVFNAAVVYPLPFFAGTQHWYRQVLGGFQLGGIVTLGSGQFLTVSQSGVDPAGLGLLAGGPSGARPNQLFSPNLGAVKARYPLQGNYFNTSAFASVTNGVPGNTPIGSVQGPGYQVWNLSLFKNFALPEHISGQVRAETFNTFNHPNPNAVNTTDGSTQFGQVTGYSDPRRMQFGAKFTF